MLTPKFNGLGAQLKLLGVGGLLIFFVSACSSTDVPESAEDTPVAEEDPEAKKQRRLLLGKVASIGQGFVLVRQVGKIRPKKGTPLISMSGTTGSKTASLSWSPENSTGFFVADIVKGTPAVGDAVMAELDQMLDGLEALTPLADPTGGVGMPELSEVNPAVAEADAGGDATAVTDDGGLTSLAPPTKPGGVIWPSRKTELMDLKPPVNPGEEPSFAPPILPGVIPKSRDSQGGTHRGGNQFPELSPPPSSRKAPAFNPRPPVAPEDEGGSFQAIPGTSIQGGDL